MIWATSKRYTPKPGDTRTTVHFAYWPKRIETKEGPVKVWLAQYERLWVYAVRQTQALIGSEVRLFDIGEWINVAEMPIKWTRA